MLFQSMRHYHLRDCHGQHRSDCPGNHTSDMETLAKRLADARIKAGYSQAELAKAAGVKNQSTIGMLESGERLKSAYVPAIAAVLRVSALWLAEGKGPRALELSEDRGAYRVEIEQTISNPEKIIPLPAWPFRRIEQSRFSALPPDEQAFVEGQLLSAIKDAELRSAGKAAANGN